MPSGVPFHYDWRKYVKKYRQLSILACATVAVLCFGTAAQADDGLSRPQSTPDTATVEATEVVEFAEEVAVEAAPEDFTGVALEEDQQILRVYLTTDDEGLRTEIQSQVAETGYEDDVVFSVSENSLAGMSVIGEALSRDFDSLVSSGIKISSFGPDIVEGHEKLTVEDLTDEQRLLLEQKYGTELLLVSIPAGEGVVATADRHDDFAPWNGGDFISGAGTGVCTTGIGVHSSTANYIITAAHCFASGTNLYNKTSWMGNGNFVGTVANRDQTAGGLDAELIAAAGSSRVWRGGTAGQGPTTSTWAGATTSPVGARVCHSGAFEGEHCFTIAQNGQTINLGGRQVSSQVLAFQNDPQAVGQGDSGGPVFIEKNGGVYAAGVISAGYGTSTRCGNWYPQITRSCFSAFYYADLGPILAKWALAVN